MNPQMTTSIPEKFLPYLGQFGPQVIDKNAGVAVGYGYPIVQQLGPELWAELGQYGKQLLINPQGPNKYYALITNVLTKKEAIRTYGPMTDVQYGPRGGFRSVTYGTTTFVDKLMKVERL